MDVCGFRRLCSLQCQIYGSACFRQSQFQGFLDRVRHEQRATVAAEHALRLANLHKFEQFVVKTGYVDQNDGFGVEFKRLPGQDLEEFLKGAKAARQDQERDGELAHESLAGVHGVDNMELLHAAMDDFLVDKDLRNDAGYVTAGSQDGIGDGAHQADTGAAIDEAEGALSEQAAKLFSGRAILGPGTFGGRAEDGNALPGGRGSRNGLRCGLEAHRQSIHRTCVCIPKPMCPRNVGLAWWKALCGCAVMLLAASGEIRLAAAQATAEPAQAGVAVSSHAASNVVGQFDYYLLDMVPGADFCRLVKDAGPQCQPQSGLVVHGLWPQNNNDTWPQFCSKQEAGTDLRASLDITPDLSLLQHEWDKHGTCTGLDGAGYFAAAHRARAQITVPQALLTATPNRTFTPLFLLNMFYQVNPGMVPGSLSLSCREDRLMAVEACFDKSLGPTPCVGLRGCEATAVSISVMR